MTPVADLETSPPFSSDQEALDLEIRKIDLIYQQNINGLVAIFANAGAYVFVASGQVSHIFLIAWVFVLTMSVLVRMIFLYHWNKAKGKIRSIQETRFWLNAMYVLLAFSGLSWGAAGVVAPSGDVTQQILTALMVCSMSAGAMITYVASRIAMACVIVPAMGGWAIGYMFSHQDYLAALGFLILVYCGLLVVMGKNLNTAIIKLLSLDTRLQKNEEHLRMAMASSDALTWDWDIRAGLLHSEGNSALFPEGAQQLLELLKTVPDSVQDLDMETIIPGSDGNPKHIALRGKFYRDNTDERSRATGIAWDITIKRNEDLLRRERDLHEAANNAKSVLLANASHEIRTPLAAILGFADTLLRSHHLDDQSRRDVQSIHRQGNFMVSLVNDLLDLSKIETNRLYIQKAPMNPASELEDSISVIRSALEDQKHSIQVHYESQIPETVLADSVRFRQVVINLLSNAVKFTSQGTITVRVSFSADASGEGTLSIQVADTGMGMDLTTQKNLFQPFFRGENAEVQRVQGSGLGLALSERLARLMGGSLKLLNSAPGQGSTFELSLQVGNLRSLKLVSAGLGRTPNMDRVTIEKETGFLKGRRVLVVDDSEDLRVLMTRYLTKQGAEVETAENGQMAISMALAKPFDVILMDLKMPVLDGYKATSELRSKGYQKSIVALTAQASVEGQKNCLENGFDGYLSKPVDMNLLNEILARRPQSHV